jgi:hypothetical protein
MTDDQATFARRLVASGASTTLTSRDGVDGDQDLANRQTSVAAAVSGLVVHEDNPLVALETLRLAHRSVVEQLSVYVRRARRRGHSWSTIADALEVTWAIVGDRFVAADSEHPIPIAGHR